MLYNLATSEKILFLVCICIVTDININQPHLFEWPQDMCEHDEGHVISHHSTCIDWLHMCRYEERYDRIATFIKMDGMHLLSRKWEPYRSLCSGSEWSYPRSSVVLGHVPHFTKIVASYIV